MPTPNYQNSVIYMLRHKDDNELENIYIGSTTNFRMRKHSHKSSCDNINGKEYNCKKYKYIRENGGWENWIMKPIEDYPCNKLSELEAREDVIMLQYANRLNKIRASRSAKEYREDNVEKLKEYSKIYREENPEKNKESKKKYYDNNVEKQKEKGKKYRKLFSQKIKEKRKIYREENAEKVKEQRKIYRENNSEKIKEKITCECGSISARNHLSRHKKTQKHLDFITQPFSSSVAS